MSEASRRGFLKSAALTTGAFAVPRFSIGQSGKSANSKVNVAVVGVGGRGGANLSGCSDENIVALCDVNQVSLDGAKKKYSNAKTFIDYRQMMDKMGKEIDAVVVATPDHSHFPAAMAAIEQGKHIYVEKPLAHNIWQVRTLKKAVKHYKVISQMGNQGHATEGIRLVKEWTEAGVLGEVKQVDAWLNGPNFESRYFKGPESFPAQAQPVPEGLAWNLWCGPAKKRPYNRCYTPLTWRSWYDFGSGLLGDWACHTLDAPFWALGLGMPSLIVPEVRADSPEGFIPGQSVIRFEFPARGKMPAVTLKWHEGGQKPENLKQWGLDKLPDTAMIMTGDKRSLMTGGRPDSPKLLLSDEEWSEFRKNRPEKTIPRIKGTPWSEWLSAIKGEGPMPGSSFDYSAELAEMVLLGVLALRTNKTIEWDTGKMRVTNHPELNAIVKEPTRKGFRFGKGAWNA